MRCDENNNSEEKNRGRAAPSSIRRNQVKDAPETTAQEQLAAAKQHLLETARRHSISEWVHENPLEAVAVAFSAGFVSGLNPSSRLPVTELVARLLSEELLGPEAPMKNTDE